MRAYACPDPDPPIHPAALARTDNPPPCPVTDHYRPTLGGELTGGDATRQLVHPAGYGAPPPAPPAAKPPNRVTRYPFGRRVKLIRTVPSFALQLGHRGDIERNQDRPVGGQFRVERRGSTYRAAPIVTDPAWAEQANQ